MLSPNAEQVEVKSPNYPDDYDNYLECTWNFETEIGNRIQFDIDDLRTGLDYDHIVVSSV